MSEARPLHWRVADMIDQRCQLKGWELGEFAKKAGLTRSSLWRITNGKVNPTDKSLRGIAKALGVLVSERESLLEESGEARLRRLALLQGVEL